MSRVFTTEIASEEMPSDNPIHQRLLRPYVLVKDQVIGDLLEVGCGEGRGVDLLMCNTTSYTAIDKIEGVVTRLKKKYPQGKFFSNNIPPLTVFGDNMFDSVVSFQVIEHIENDNLFLQEIQRVLKPGGRVWITTPNRLMSLSRNPWHVREYTAAELAALAKKHFSAFELKGITGNDKVMQYHERNRASVNKMMRWDILNLQYRLPASWLRIPYEFMNRRNRNMLKDQADELVLNISQDDYLLSDRAEQALDLLLIAVK